MKRSRFFATQVSSACRMLASALGSLAITLSLCSTGSAATLPVFSWETGLEGWTAVDATLTADGVLGVTDGVQALHNNGLTSGFKNDVGVATFNAFSPVPFDGMDAAAAAIQGGATDVTLEFDLAVDTTNVTANGFAQLGMFVNSTPIGFKQYGTGNFIGGNATTSFPQIEGAALAEGATVVNIGGNQYHVSVPMGPANSLNIGRGSFFQIGFKSNGGWSGTMDLGIDNMFVSGSTVPEPSTFVLFGFAAACMVVQRKVRKSS